MTLKKFSLNLISYFRLNRFPFLSNHGPKDAKPSSFDPPPPTPFLCLFNLSPFVRGQRKRGKKSERKFVSAAMRNLSSGEIIPHDAPRPSIPHTRSGGREIGKGSESMRVFCGDRDRKKHKKGGDWKSPLPLNPARKRCRSRKTYPTSSGF